MKWIWALVLCCLFITPARADSFIEDFEKITFIQRYLQKIDDDIYAYYGWFDEEGKGLTQEKIDLFVTELEETKEVINERVFIIDGGTFKETFIADINKSIEVLNRSFGLSSEEFYQLRGEAFAPTQEREERLALNTTFITNGLNRYLEDLPKDLTIQDAQREFFRGTEHEEEYAQVIELMQDKEYRQAFDILIDIYQKETSIAHQYMMLLAMSDCIEMGDLEILVKDVEHVFKFLDDEENEEDSDDQTLAEDEAELLNSVILLSPIVDQPVYFPFIYRAFIAARTHYQLTVHGASNMSEIPTLLYLEIRKRMVDAIKEYVNDHPNDAWAKRQHIYLLLEDIITHMPEYGNSVLYDYHYLYMQAEEEEKAL